MALATFVGLLFVAVAIRDAGYRIAQAISKEKA
jgi:hypothetical protein